MALGGRTIREWQEIMSGEEFCDWMAYYQLQPFGEWRGDLRAALIAQTMANIHAKKGHSFSLKDFTLAFKRRGARPQRAAMSGDQVVSFFQGLQRGG